MDLIDRAEVHDLIAKRLSDYLTDESRGELEELDIKVEEDIPTVQEPKTGHWINQDEGAFYPIECSECHKEPLLDSYGDYVFSNYCPVCGARMVGDNNDR